MTHRISIFGSLIPNSGGKSWFEPLSVLGTNDAFARMLGRIDQDGNNNAQLSTREGFYGSFNVPKNYVGTAIIIPVWTATVTSGDIVWDVDYRAVGGNDSESLDQSGAQESLTATDTNPSAAWERMETELALTSSNLAVDDTVQFLVMRDGVAAGDTAAAATLLCDLIFQYADA